MTISTSKSSSQGVTPVDVVDVTADIEAGDSEISPSLPWPRRDTHGRVVFASISTAHAFTPATDMQSTRCVRRKKRPNDGFHRSFCVWTNVARYYIGFMPVLMERGGEHWSGRLPKINPLHPTCRH